MRRKNDKDKIKILHVDDNEDFLLLTKSKLQNIHEDIQVQTTESSKDAAKIIKEEEYNLILSDYDMPEMDGAALLQTLRDEGDETPFIFFTGSSQTKDMDKLKSSDAKGTIEKDWRQEVFEELAEQIVKHSK